MTVAKSDPSVFDFPDEMERLYGEVHNGDEPQEKPRVFFRGHRTAQEILSLSKSTNFKPYQDKLFEQGELFNPSLDVGLGCGDSCEAGADE